MIIILYEKGDGYYLLLTKRTMRVMRHKGQISFPGGEYEEDDGTLKTTALRECYEEIGVKKEDVKILDTLDVVNTRKSNFIIKPFVATIPFPYEFKANEFEVEKIIEIPLSFLLAERNYKKDRWTYNNHVIWGVTARILNRFIEKYKIIGFESLFSNI